MFQVIVALMAPPAHDHPSLYHCAVLTNRGGVSVSVQRMGVLYDSGQSRKVRGGGGGGVPCGKWGRGVATPKPSVSTIRSSFRLAAIINYHSSIIYFGAPSTLACTRGYMLLPPATPLTVPLGMLLADVGSM